VGKTLEMSSNGLGFEQLMKILVSTPKEKIEKPANKKKRKRSRIRTSGDDKSLC